jgi:glycosyltransferase involved in cell wall biosynthesis
MCPNAATEPAPAAAGASAPRRERPAAAGAALRIGFLLPAHYCFSRGNGVRQEGLLKQRGLTELGQQVALLSPWDALARGALDVVHFFYGGLALADIAAVRQIAPRRLVFSTTIDSNQGHAAYRLAAWLGGLHGRVRSVQGEFRRQAMLADAVVVRSEHERERVVRGLGIPAAKVHLVHLGIDLDGVDAARAGTGGREGVFHLSTFGQPRKNVLRLIAAVGPTGLPLTIAGACAPAELPAVQAAAAPFPNIVIRGFLSADERDELYYRSRVFALPSLHEGTGLSALEAGARGCAVVITKNGGPPDYFAGIGHLIDPLSVAELRAAIVAAHAERAPALTAERIAARFNLTSCAQRLLSVYRG